MGLLTKKMMIRIFGKKGKREKPMTREEVTRDKKKRGPNKAP